MMRGISLHESGGQDDEATHQLSREARKILRFLVTTSKGRLEGGVQLPSSGPNFVSYGSIPELIGRTFVHSKVRDVIVAAYEILESEQTGKMFKYAETGAKQTATFLRIRRIRMVFPWASWFPSSMIRVNQFIYPPRRSIDLDMTSSSTTAGTTADIELTTRRWALI